VTLPQDSRHEYKNSARNRFRSGYRHHQGRGPAIQTIDHAAPRVQLFARRTVIVKEEDDATLVRLCREGDRGAFERLVVRYQKPVFNAALRMLREPQDAMDVAQTTFLKAYEHLADYDPGFKFYSWIYRIAVNESLDALGSRKSFEAIDGEEQDDAPGPDRQVQGEQTQRALEEALMRMQPELRSVIVLRHFMHLSYEDMGDILALPAKTVKSRLYTARQLLRDELLRCEVF
jgi:RNA polymerase sigma-70 factor (ECF subfamily)